MADYGDTMFGSQAATDYYNQLQAVSSANNAFNAAQAEKQMKFQEQANAKAMDFNARQAEMTRSWQEMMSNTAYQRQVKDMVAAGLNPVLGVSNSGAAVPSGATASGSAGSGAKAEADTTMASAFSAMVNALVQGQTARDVAEINAKTSMHNAELSAQAVLASAGLSAEASKYGSGLAAAASRFASEMALESTKYSTEGSWNRMLMEQAHDTYIHENYPSTIVGGISAIANALVSGFDTTAAKLLGDMPFVPASVFDAITDVIQHTYNKTKTEAKSIGAKLLNGYKWNGERYGYEKVNGLSKYGD